MAEQRDEDEPARLYARVEFEVEAIPDVLWQIHLRHLEPWLQAELKEVTRSDGFQTYMPRIVWLLLGRIETHRQRLI